MGISLLNYSHCTLDDQYKPIKKLLLFEAKFWRRAPHLCYRHIISCHTPRTLPSTKGSQKQSRAKQAPQSCTPATAPASGWSRWSSIQVVLAACRSSLYPFSFLSHFKKLWRRRNIHCQASIFPLLLSRITHEKSIFSTRGRSRLRN